MSVPSSEQLLADPAYAHRVRLRGYNGPVSVFSAVSERDAANVLIHAMPGWSREDHLELAIIHAQYASDHRSRYEAALDAAALETFGRPFQFLDYQVCCIGREEFSTEMKSLLRQHGYAAPKHEAISRAHEAASRSRRSLM